MISSSYMSEPFNGRRTRITEIGTVTVAEPFERTNHFETACNYEVVRVPAGTYPVRLCWAAGTKWVMVGYEGERVDYHYVNRLFTATSLAPKQGIGEPARCASQLYAYQAAEAFATKDEWELAEDWSLGSEERTYSDGRPYTAWHLVSPDGERVAI